MTTVQQMIEALETFEGVSCAAKRLSPNTLRDLMRAHPDAVVILPVRRKSNLLNHAICILEVNREMYLAADYPALLSWRSEQDLSEMWDGHAIVVRRRESLMLSAAIATLPGLVVGLLVCVARALIDSHQRK